jgi:hypothetical protein
MIFLVLSIHSLEKAACSRLQWAPYFPEMGGIQPSSMVGVHFLASEIGNKP